MRRFEKFRVSIFFFLILFCSLDIEGQNLDGQFASIISNLGYENVTVLTEDDTVFIGYENRLYRDQVEGLIELMKSVIPLSSDFKYAVFLIQNRNLPILSVTTKTSVARDYFEKKISKREFADELKISYEIENLWKRINGMQNKNSSNYKFDIVLNPGFKAEFGPYSNPVLAQVNFIPALHTKFWRGMNFMYEQIFPIYNELGARDDSIRPGRIVLNQVFRFPGSLFISASAGFFSRDRYGFDLEAKKYWEEGTYSLGLNFGYTGYAAFAGTKLYYSYPYLWNALLSAEYRITKYDLTLGISGGRFLYKDTSLRFDINREFGEIQLGFFVVVNSEGNKNGGFNFSVPLFPSGYWKPGIVRIRTAENFSFGYIVKSTTESLIGLRYSTGSDIKVFLDQLNPGYIKNRISKSEF